VKALIGALLMVAFVAAYWPWVLAVVVVVLIAKAAPVAWQEVQGERAVEERRRAELVARADEQHRWATAGDPRGTFGIYPPGGTG
jgi:hypothetical protein